MFIQTEVDTKHMIYYQYNYEYLSHSMSTNIWSKYSIRNANILISNNNNSDTKYKYSITGGGIQDLHQCSL